MCNEILHFKANNALMKTLKASVLPCDFCDAFVHIKCENIAPKMYDLAVRTKFNISLTCNRCCLKEMYHTNVFGDMDESMRCFDVSTADVGSDCVSVF